MMYITPEAYAAMREVAYAKGERDFSERGIDRESRAPLIGVPVDPNLEAAFSRHIHEGETISDCILRAAASYQGRVS